jgi:hypothetical protein
VFLGFVAQCGTDEVVTPFIEPGRAASNTSSPRSIRTVANAARKKVGILKTDRRAHGRLRLPDLPAEAALADRRELQQQYKIENVDPTRTTRPASTASSCRSRSSLVQEQMDRLQSWMLAGIRRCCSRTRHRSTHGAPRPTTRRAACRPA